MQYIKSMDELDIIDANTAVALGMFDGLHIGHQSVINDMIILAHKEGLKSCVFTFQNHPRELTTENKAPQRILTTEDKIQLMGEYGIDILVCIPFDEQMMCIEAEDFVKDVLVTSLNAKHVFAGFDYHFGCRAEGNVKMLEKYAQSFGYEFHVINPVIRMGQKVSSSAIRVLLHEGDVEEVFYQLGRHHFVSGIVVKGKQLGNKLGFPTANLSLSPNMSLIRAGVYITKTLVDDELYYSITNVGYNPTFEETFRIETHILGFDKIIYGKKVSVIFYKRIRDEKKFESYDKLISTIEHDKNFAKEYFNLE